MKGTAAQEKMAPLVVVDRPGFLWKFVMAGPIP